MAVQVLIRRKFVKEKAKELAPLIVNLRSLATMQALSLIHISEPTRPTT